MHPLVLFQIIKIGQVNLSILTQAGPQEKEHPLFLIHKLSDHLLFISMIIGVVIFSMIAKGADNLTNGLK